MSTPEILQRTEYVLQNDTGHFFVGADSDGDGFVSCTKDARHFTDIPSETYGYTVRKILSTYRKYDGHSTVPFYKVHHKKGKIRFSCCCCFCGWETKSYALQSVALVKWESLKDTVPCSLLLSSVLLSED